MVETVEVRRIIRTSIKVVVHTKPCADCDGHGGAVTCGHGANCPCTGWYEVCPTCDGRGEVKDEDCYCPRCEALAEQEGLT